MDTLFQSFVSGLTAVTPVGIGFALGFAMWLMGAAIGAIFKAFNASSGLESNDD